MKFSKALIAIFVSCQYGIPASSAFVTPIKSASFVAKKPSSSSSALNYKINENEQFEQEHLTVPQPARVGKEFKTRVRDLKKPVANNGATLPAKPAFAEPTIGGGKRFDLTAANAARTKTQEPKNIGAVRGAFQSLAGTNSVKQIQGGKCLKTWNLADDRIERVAVMLNNDGVPLSGHVEVWQGPKSTPMKVQIASDDGDKFPFSAVLEVPGKHNSVAVKNMSPMEFHPMGACVIADVEDAEAGGKKKAGQGAVVAALDQLGEPYKVEGEEDQQVFQFENTVESVQVMLKTDGRPLHGRIELVQGPDEFKQVIDVFSENGLEQPFFAVIDTPSMFDMSGGATVRIVNTAPSTVFPLTAIVEPYMVTESYVPPAKPETKIDITDDLFFLSTDE